MKGILEFDLNDFDETLAHKRAVSATNAYLVLLGVDDFLRNKMKYNELTEEVDAAFQEARDVLSALKNEHGINMNDLP